MAKEELLEFPYAMTGVARQRQRQYQARNENAIIAHTAGRMRKNRIRVLGGDTVLIEMTPYDLAKGRITCRFK